jgi:hypothetical protein
MLLFFREEVEIVAVEPPEAKDSLIDSAVLIDNVLHHNNIA